MIGSLRGRIASQGEDWILLEVGGMGFQVYVPQPLLRRPAAVGTEIQLHTHLHVRDNDVALYGFETEEDWSLFRILLSVTGIGPKLALVILSTHPAEEFRAAVAQGDIEALIGTPGIGRRTAERLVLDLRDKVGGEGVEPVPVLSARDAEVVTALTALGYSLSEARGAVSSLSDGELALEERVVEALRQLGGE
ncbi:MAG: Holliday junction branch migration protein RuvA [Anaerolineae bacterium]